MKGTWEEIHKEKIDMGMEKHLVYYGRRRWYKGAKWGVYQTVLLAHDVSHAKNKWNWMRRNNRESLAGLEYKFIKAVPISETKYAGMTYAEYRNYIDGKFGANNLAMEETGINRFFRDMAEQRDPDEAVEYYDITRPDDDDYPSWI